ncbi:response regulator transcription factor [Paenibacillus planticolens]|uniref:Response regulator n=1 Tax=Paenibacillus planticolens TaxID=2654976 RepID=A0ABX1ZHI6_9BACL|nr:response regulator [Paenibacillus planticolens]NOU98897.1 response regulator [Paenibacillus planticolens]
MTNVECRAVIIDDEAWIREGLSEHIDWKKLGIVLVKVFHDGADAFAYLKEEPVDIILSDIRMPNMTGLEMLAKLRDSASESAANDFSRIKTIFLSGYNDFKFAQEALRLGAVDFLLKPSDLVDIENALLKAKHLWTSNGAIQFKQLCSTEPTEEPGSYLIKRALNYIHAHFAEEIHLTDIAKELSVTPNHLSRLFRQDIDQSFSDYLSQMRMNKACSLLVESNMKIYQIGDMLAYTNPRCFREWFQKNTGMSPVEYRKKHT